MLEETVAKAASSQPDNVFTLILGFLSLFASGSTAWLWYDRKRRDKRLDAHSQELKTMRETIIRHESKFVDDPTVRNLVRDETQNLKENHAELKGMVSELSKQVGQISTSQEVQTEILKGLAAQIEEMKNR